MKSQCKEVPTHIACPCLKASYLMEDVFIKWLYTHFNVIKYTFSIRTYSRSSLNSKHGIKTQF